MRSPSFSRSSNPAKSGRSLPALPACLLLHDVGVRHAGARDVVACRSRSLIFRRSPRVAPCRAHLSPYQQEQPPGTIKAVAVRCKQTVPQGLAFGTRFRAWSDCEPRWVAALSSLRPRDVGDPHVRPSAICPAAATPRAMPRRFYSASDAPSRARHRPAVPGRRRVDAPVDAAGSDPARRGPVRRSR